MLNMDMQESGPSDSESSSSDGERRLLNLKPLDDNAHMASKKPPRYASLSDFAFLPQELKMITDAGPGCGGHLWPSAVVLSQYLHYIVASNPLRWQHKTCIELGAGTGVVACALGTLRVPGLKIWSTDLEELLPLARQNVILNGVADNVIVEELYWGRPLPDTVPHKPDLLLLADCIYLEITFPWLIETMLLLTNENTEILLCYKKRRSADRRFFIMLKKYFTYQHVQDDPHRPTYERQGLQLYNVKRKPASEMGKKAGTDKAAAKVKQGAAEIKMIEKV